MNIKPRWFFVLMVMLVGMCGCRRAGYLDEKDRSNRLVSKATEMVDLGEYDSAVQLFRKVLDTYPELARPHLDLALLLHDQHQDYMRAIYHYNRYLELRPNTEKDTMILSRIEQAERAFVASRVTVNGVDGPSAMQLLEENGVLRKQVASLETTVAEQEKALHTLREAERRRVRDQVITGTVTSDAGSNTAVEAMQSLATQTVDRAALEPTSTPSQAGIPLRLQAVSAPVVAPPGVAASADTTVAIPSLPFESAAPDETDSGVDGIVRTYTVQRGDSLSRIAFKVYGDATLWRGIQDANRDVLGNSVNVRVGQVLKIP